MDAETENITGTVIEVRGPFQDDSYELDIEKGDGEIVTIAIGQKTYEELLDNHLRFQVAN